MNRDLSLTLQLLPGEFTIHRLSAAAPLPQWVLAGESSALCSITRTADELSIVCESARVVAETQSSETGWSCLRVQGPLAFEMVGVLQALSSTLAEAGVSIFAISTFDTDYLLVRSEQAQRAIESLRRHGHRVAVA